MTKEFFRSRKARVLAVSFAAAAFAVPAVWGISHNLKICARIIVSASPFGRSVAKSARSRAYRLFHSVFFTLLALFFSAVYFSRTLSQRL